MIARSFPANLPLLLSIRFGWFIYFINPHANGEMLRVKKKGDCSGKNVKREKRKG